jgi:hypothetical protein
MNLNTISFAFGRQGQQQKKIYYHTQKIKPKKKKSGKRIEIHSLLFKLHDYGTYWTLRFKQLAYYLPKPQK